MLSTCVTVEGMGKMIQIRHVPEELHRTLKARAAMEGMSLSDYLLAELRRVAERPSRSELLARLKKSEPVELDISVVDLLAEERNQR
jgi:plasmid stability protein